MKSTKVYICRVQKCFDGEGIHTYHDKVGGAVLVCGKMLRHQPVRALLELWWVSNGARQIDQAHGRQRG